MPSARRCPSARLCDRGRRVREGVGSAAAAGRPRLCWRKGRTARGRGGSVPTQWEAEALALPCTASPFAPAWRLCPGVCTPASTPWLRPWWSQPENRWGVRLRELRTVSRRCCSLAVWQGRPPGFSEHPGMKVMSAGGRAGGEAFGGRPPGRRGRRSHCSFESLSQSWHCLCFWSLCVWSGLCVCSNHLPRWSEQNAGSRKRVLVASAPMASATEAPRWLLSGPAEPV